MSLICCNFAQYNVDRELHQCISISCHVTLRDGVNEKLGVYWVAFRLHHGAILLALYMAYRITQDINGGAKADPVTFWVIENPFH